MNIWFDKVRNNPQCSHDHRKIVVDSQFLVGTRNATRGTGKEEIVHC
jgi:hypothetical protein